MKTVKYKPPLTKWLKVNWPIILLFASIILLITCSVLACLFSDFANIFNAGVSVFAGVLTGMLLYIYDRFRNRKVRGLEHQKVLYDEIETSLVNCISKYEIIVNDFDKIKNLNKITFKVFDSYRLRIGLWIPDFLRTLNQIIDFSDECTKKKITKELKDVYVKEYGKIDNAKQLYDFAKRNIELHKTWREIFISKWWDANNEKIMYNEALI